MIFLACEKQKYVCYTLAKLFLYIYRTISIK